MASETTSIGGTYRKIDYNTSTGAVSSDRTFGAPAAKSTLIRTDRPRSRKPSGWLNPKAYTHHIVTDRYPLGEKWLYDSRGRTMSYWQGCIPGTTAFGADVNPLPTDGLYEKALAKCYALLKDERINLGVALAESQATARTIGSGFDDINRFLSKAGRNLQRVARAAQAVRKGQAKKAAGILGIGVPKNATSRWLSYQYGWLPLLSDIHGSAEALGKGPPNNLTKGCKAWAGIDDDRTLFKSGTGFVDKQRIKRLTGVFVRLDFEPSNTFLQAISGLGLTNPASVAWELVPFSFVVDWALPIGDYLSALDADLGWRFKIGSVSTFRKCEGDLQFDHTTDGRRAGKYHASHRSVRFDRSVISTQPAVPLPTPKNPFSIGHAANGLSLLAEVAKRPPRV